MQEAPSDEIDLIELVQVLWNGKWYIGAFTGISLMLSIAGVLTLPPSFEGRLDIAALDSTKISGFAPLNDTPGISQPIYSGGKLISQKGVIFRGGLYNAFVAELRKGQFFSKAHEEIDPEFIKFEGDKSERLEKLAKLRNRYKLIIDEDDPLRGSLRFSFGDKELGRAVVTRAFKKINENIRREHLRGIVDLQRSIEASLDYEIEEVERTISNAFANYETKTAARLARLTEQAAIARQLGIADNQAGLTARGTNGIGINVNTNLPLYLRGFKALEKEIALIRGRGTGNDLAKHIPDFPELEARLRALKSDKRLERIEKSILLTPLADSETFTAVDFSLETVTFKSTTSKRLIVILATLMSGMIAVMFVLIRHFVAQRKQAV